MVRRMSFGGDKPVGGNNPSSGSSAPVSNQIEDDVPFENDEVERLMALGQKDKPKEVEKKPVEKKKTNVNDKPFDGYRGGGVVKPRKPVNVRQRMQEVLAQANSTPPGRSALEDMGFEEEKNPKPKPQYASQGTKGDSEGRKLAKPGRTDDGRYVHRYSPKSKQMVDAIAKQAFDLGWSEYRLYNNIGRLPYPYLDDYGLICFLEDTVMSGNTIEIGEITEDWVKLNHINKNSGAVSTARFMREQHGMETFMTDKEDTDPVKDQSRGMTNG